MKFLIAALFFVEPVLIVHVVVIVLCYVFGWHIILKAMLPYLPNYSK